LRLDDFVLYLDENLHNCQPVLEALELAEVRYERHGKHFEPGTADSVWLPFVGSNGWILITKDKNIRYNELEKDAIIQYRLREFYFVSGNLNKHDMARILATALPDIFRLCQREPPPFIASITKLGKIHLRYTRRGARGSTGAKSE
jgi:hypothetical protein